MPTTATQPLDAAQLRQRFNEPAANLSPTERLVMALDSLQAVTADRDAARARVAELEGQLAAVTTERDQLKVGQSTAPAAPAAPAAAPQFKSLENMTLTERARCAIALKQAQEGGA